MISFTFISKERLIAVSVCKIGHAYVRGIQPENGLLTGA